MAFKFLKTGAESAALAKKAADDAEARKESQGRLFRFWLKEKEDARITFVDGDLNAEGFLCPPRYYEHNLFLKGSWNNFFVCPEKTNPAANDACPICASPDRPSLVALFTVIDHRTFTSSRDKTKVYKDTKRLLVAKPQTFELLNRAALKRGGLTGCTFDVSRVGDKAAAVGSVFDFVDKKTVAELKPLYMQERTDPKTNQKVKVSYFVPADYETEIQYLTGAQLTKKIAGETPETEEPAGEAGEVADYSKEL